ncbi:MAG: hypothetical protein ACM3N7_02430 [Planctomycetaceae bacterium]
MGGAGINIAKPLSPCLSLNAEKSQFLIRKLHKSYSFGKPQGATGKNISKEFESFGQHNREVYGGILGISDAEMEKLKGEGII